MKGLGASKQDGASEGHRSPGHDEKKEGDPFCRDGNRGSERLKISGQESQLEVGCGDTTP